MRRRQLAAWIGLSGAGLLLCVGFVQAVAGDSIPEWTGAKLAHGALGLLTVGLAVLAALAATGQRRAAPGVLARAGCSVGLAGPGLLALTTVGRLAYLPALLLVVAGLLAVEDWRATGTALASDWSRVLLTLVGCCELLVVAAGPLRLMAVAAVGAPALVAAAWWRGAARRTVAGLLVLGTLPLAALGWAAVVPLVVAAAAWLVAVPLIAADRRSRLESSVRSDQAEFAGDRDRLGA